MLVHVQRRRDVQQTHVPYLLWGVEYEPMRYSSSTIMREDVEGIMAEVRPVFVSVPFLSPLFLVARTRGLRSTS